MLSELQKRKLPNLFGLHDLNHDGYLEWEDFEKFCRRMGETRGWKSKSPEYQELVARFRVIWDGLIAEADTNQDRRVSLGEWFQFWDGVLNTEGGYERVVSPISTFLYQILDGDGDGKVDANEYALIYIYTGNSAERASMVFAQLDLDRDGILSIEELNLLLRQFFCSSDPEAPGNVFFGPI